MLLLDKDEVWYSESIGGHVWAAIRISDELYVVLPNRSNITDFDLLCDDTMSSADRCDLIETYVLYPDPEGYNCCHISGSATM